MPSLVYYGLDNIDHIPATIPLTDRSENITKPWSFTDVLINGKLDLKGNLSVQGTFFVNGASTMNNSLTVGGNTWIKGDLYVNTNSMNQDTVNALGEVQNGGGNIFAGRIRGTSYAALYRDLGERFEIDIPQPKGTIVSLYGDKEITKTGLSLKPFGIIASEPALRMNDGDDKDDEHFPFVCWCGRVPCRVTGEIHKFDKIVLSCIPGVGIAHPNPYPEDIVGIALESKDTKEEGLVEVITMARPF